MTLRADGVGYVYGRGTGFAVAALDGVTLEIGRGELVLVLGRTGSGKSTLLRLLAGLLAPTAGRVSVDDEDPASPGARGRVGLVFQDPEAQLFGETVLEDVAFGPANLGRTREESRADSAAALTAVGLEPGVFAERSPFTLSGGEARRTAIAGVLAMRPAYLLLDEPTAGLDASGRRVIRETVARMRREAGVVVVSHDAEDWLADAGRVVAMAGGRVVFSGSVAGIIGSPAAFAEAGLEAPGVLRAWELAAARGLICGEPTLDPAVLASAIAGSKGAGA